MSSNSPPLPPPIFSPSPPSYTSLSFLVLDKVRYNPRDEQNFNYEEFKREVTKFCLPTQVPNMKKKKNSFFDLITDVARL